MSRNAVLTISASTSDEKRVETLTVIVASDKEDQSRAAKLRFVDGRAVYVAYDPGRYALIWRVDGEKGASVALNVMEGERVLLTLSKQDTAIPARGYRYGYIYFEVP
jgi:hypothetical protein